MKQTNIPEIKIVSRDFKATDSIKQRVEEGLSKQLKKLKDIKAAVVTLTKTKGTYGVQILLHTKGPVIKVKSNSFDTYTAIDDSIDKLKNQLSRRSKKGERSQKRHTLRYAPYANPSLEIDLDEVFGKILPLELKRKRKKYAVAEKILSETEALLELKKSKKKYLIYINSNSLNNTYVTA